MTESDSPIASVLASYKAAVYAKDLEAFVALYDPQVHAFDMWGQWSFSGIEAWRGMAAGWFSSLGEDRDVVDFNDVQSIVTPGLVIAHATATYTAVNSEGSKLRSLDDRVTLVLQRRGGVWKIVHQHSSVPLDDATKGILSRPA